MTQPRPPKKSESIEIRIPHPTKAAFMDKARSEGRAASDIVREQIDAYLGGPRPQPVPPPSLLSRLKPRHIGALALLPLLIGGVLAAAGASAPAAQPDLKPAFAALDADHDGYLTRAEFVTPAAAHEIDLRGVQPGLDGSLAIGGPNREGAYVRFVLRGADGDVPLLIAVDPPAPGKPGDAEIAQLAGRAFDRLDRDGDGMLAESEFMAR